MAEKRMFAKSIVLSDAFLDMPMSARCLYFTLSMFADDDGFVGSPKGIMRQCGASQDDMMVLLQKRFILAFESGVIVIKHWRINNFLRNDRHKDTTYQEELSTLMIDEKGAYKEVGIPTDNQLTTNGIPSIDIDKNSIDKNIYSLADEVIDYLNKTIGAKYKPRTKKTIDLIKARANEGFTLEDFQVVISKKAAEWLGTDMEKFLRPETLFGTKFEGYLNQQTKKKTQFNDFPQRKYDFKSLEKELLAK